MTLKRRRVAAAILILIATAPILSGCTPEGVVYNVLAALMVGWIIVLVIAIILIN